MTEEDFQSTCRFVYENKDNGKRPVFQLDYLDDWLKWAMEKEWMFINKVNDEVNGVVIIYPIGRWVDTPTLEDVFRCSGNTYIDNDYFIMDALVDNEDARANICRQIDSRFPEIRGDENSQIFSQRGDIVQKLKKELIINLTNN
jgi:hypothetical protein